jgi:hypothetical protein
MGAIFVLALTVTKPVIVGIGLAVLAGLYLAFKVGKFLFKLLLALAVLGLVAWWYFALRHGSP